MVVDDKDDDKEEEGEDGGGGDTGPKVRLELFCEVFFGAEIGPRRHLNCTPIHQHLNIIIVMVSPQDDDDCLDTHLVLDCL